MKQILLPAQNPLLTLLEAELIALRQKVTTLQDEIAQLKTENAALKAAPLQER